MTVSPQWLAIVRDVVGAAVEGLSIQEFNRRSILQPHGVNASHLDRVRVLEQLIEDQLIAIDDRFLTLGSIDGIGWLMEGLQAGDSLVWEIAQLIDVQERVVRKFDNERLLEIGLIGEEFVISELQRILPENHARRIRHVSIGDDTAGYDIVAPSVNRVEQMSLLEVKTTVRPGKDFVCYLSRNEFRVGSNNSNWSLVCVRLVDNSPVLVGHIALQLIRDAFPIDQEHLIRWETCRVQIPLTMLQPGLP